MIDTHEHQTDPGPARPPEADAVPSKKETAITTVLLVLQSDIIAALADKPPNHVQVFTAFVISTLLKSAPVEPASVARDVDAYRAGWKRADWRGYYEEVMDGVARTVAARRRELREFGAV